MRTDADPSPTDASRSLPFEQGDLGELLSRGDNTLEGNGADMVGTIGTYTPR